MGDLEKEIEVPSFFVCPISLEIMKDPVTLSTGITYDREAIEKWLYTLKKGTCPLTKQVLTDIELTPNHTLRRLIQSWCTINAPFGIERFPTPRLPISKSQILKLLQDSKYTPNLQMKSLKRLKTIALESDMNKRSMEAVGAADYLAHIIISNPSSSNMTSSSPAGEVSGVDGFVNLLTPVDEAVSILFHLRLSQPGLKSLFGKTGEFIEALSSVMQRAASYESRTYAVLLLKSMFEVAEPIQVMSLKTHFFIELTQILAQKISEKATKAALKILIGVCPWGRNRIKAVEAGAVSVLIDTLLNSTEKRVSEMVLTVLDQLCKSADGRAELLKHGAGLAVVSKKIFRVSEAASGKAVRILHSVAKFSGNSSVVQEMLQLGVVRKLFMVVQADCGSKTSEKAMEILKMHAKAWKNSSCITYNLSTSYPF
ncbi:hypothetical protein L6452_09523 [Arctium lappa]|uniref:Uncharacterized protein n=1 Tax=Arctium lappa TaxID=4217 RepID=A0ACB9DL50_ARCLA|nr:hypothetical protein L6452_09523 [Arctium lappa]